MYRPGLGELGFAVGSALIGSYKAAGFILQDNKTISIGTTTPGLIGGVNGSLTFTAAGAAQSIIFTPSTTGVVQVVTSNATDSVSLSAINSSNNASAKTRFNLWNDTSTFSPTSGLSIFFASSAAGTYANAGGFWNYTATGTLNFATNNTQRVRISAGGNMLLGGLITDGTGVLQFPAHSTTAGGIGLGGTGNFIWESDANTVLIGRTVTDSQVLILQSSNTSSTNPAVFRIRAGSSAAATELYSGGGTAASNTILDALTGSLNLRTTLAQNVNLAYNSVIVLQLDSTTNFTVVGTKTLRFGVTAGGTIGSVGSDATTDILTFTAPSTGGLSLIGTPLGAGSPAGISVGGTGGLPGTVSVINRNGMIVKQQATSTYPTAAGAVALTVQGFDSTASTKSFQAINSNGTNTLAALDNLHVLIGNITTDGTGTLQFATSTIADGGITFGTDVNFYRTAAGVQRLDNQLLVGTGTTSSNTYGLEVRGPSPGNTPARFVTANTNGGGIDIYDANNSALRLFLGHGSNSGITVNIQDGVVNAPGGRLILGSNNLTACTFNTTQDMTLTGNFNMAAGKAIKLGNARAAGAAVQGGTVTVLDSAGATIQLLCV